YNEVLGFLANNDLDDLCVSRPKKRVGWGIDFPIDDNFVVYVWFDALLNYISGIGFNQDKDKFNKWWPTDIHLIGKDILRQHAIFWPIMLKALNLQPPAMIFANGWWKVGEEKMSKSRGNIVNPEELIKTIGTDGLRYFLLREIPLGMDGNFSWSAIKNRFNSDLANDLGNLVYRTLSMVEKYFERVIVGNFERMPDSFKECLDNLQKKYIPYMENLDFPSVLEEIWQLVNTMNKFIEDTKPWLLWKENKVEDLRWFLFSLLEGIRIVSIYIYPFMPQTSIEIMNQLGRDDREINLKKAIWQRDSFKITKGKPLFSRIDAD
ncbi:MAG: class I tRNA ligase family protein, partial [Candidatus Omnitrophica bacterium]|nr:class I tRNA ligase family protein [Candidatus Omnitrophota bacterium]